MATNAEIVPAAPAPAAALTVTSRATILRASIDADHEQRQLLAEYVKKNMVDTVDYGIIPGTKQKTLLKPGAEKLVDLFRCEPFFTITQRVEDWDRNLFHYEIKCELKGRENGYVYAQGLGSCNSREGRYRWRKADRTCPDCGQPTIIKGKAEYGGGWLCYKNKGGCGAKFGDNAPEIVDQPSGKVENDDIASQVNTILKMAKKRSLVDASIALARCSDLFTQDMEDSEEPEPRRAAPRQQQQQRVARSTDRPPPPDSDPESYVIQSGKHEGKLMRDLDDRSLSWFAENSRNREMKAAAQAVLERRIERAALKNRQNFDDMTQGDNWGLSSPGDDSNPDRETDGHDEYGKP